MNTFTEAAILLVPGSLVAAAVLSVVAKSDLFKDIRRLLAILVIGFVIAVAIERPEWIAALVAWASSLVE